MSYSTKTRILDTLIVPGITGATAAVATFATGDSFSSKMRMFGMDVSTPIAVGLTTLGASLLGEVIGNWALPYIPGNFKGARTEKMLIKPVATGAALIALMMVAAPEALHQGSYVFPFLLGAGSEVAGRYLSDIVRPDA